MWLLWLFSLIQCLSSPLCIISFCAQKFYFDTIQFVYFVVIVYTFGVTSKKKVLNLMLQIFLLSFLLRVFPFPFRFWIHFDLIFEYHVNWGSSLILFHILKSSFITSIFDKPYWPPSVPLSNSFSHVWSAISRLSVLFHSSTFISIPHCFDFCDFVVSSNMSKKWKLHFFQPFYYSHKILYEY